MAVNIIKTSPGGPVQIIEPVSKFVFKQLEERASLFLSNKYKGGGVWVVDKDGQELHIKTEEVLQTQILPAAPVEFSGNSSELYELLEKDFFYNLVNPPGSGGGGAPDETNIKLIGVNYTALASDYILVATASLNITLPASPTLGQIYKIGANNNNIEVFASGADLIIGKPSIKLRKYSSIIIQYIDTNTWLIF